MQISRPSRVSLRRTSAHLVCFYQAEISNLSVVWLSLRFIFQTMRRCFKGAVALWLCTRKNPMQPQGWDFNFWNSRRARIAFWAISCGERFPDHSSSPIFRLLRSERSQDRQTISPLRCLFLNRRSRCPIDRVLAHLCFLQHLPPVLLQPTRTTRRFSTQQEKNNPSVMNFLCRWSPLRSFPRSCLLTDRSLHARLHHQAPPRCPQRLLLCLCKRIFHP